jgi:hypothetical protein
MKKIFLISFLFLIQSIYNLSLQDFFESLLSTYNKENVDLGDCLNDDFINGLNLINSGLIEKNNKKFTLGFISVVEGCFNCVKNTKLLSLMDILKNLNITIGSIDFESGGKIISNLINSLFDESGNYITYGEAIGNALLKIQEMLQ